MAEGSDRTEENKEQPHGETLEEFRWEVVKEHESAGLGENAPDEVDLGAERATEAAGQRSKSERGRAERNNAPTDSSQREAALNETDYPNDSDANVQGSPESSQVSLSPKRSENHEGPIPSNEIEEARLEILDEFGPDGLGKAPSSENPEMDTPEGHQENPSEGEFSEEMGSLSRSGSQAMLTELEQGPREPAKEPPDSDVENSDLQRLQDSSFEHRAALPNQGQDQSLESDAKLESSRENVEDSPAISNPFDNQFRGTGPALAQTGEVGREIEYELQGTVLTGIDSAKEPDNRVLERQTEREDSIEVLKASGYGHTSALLVPERMIPPHDQRSEIFEVRVARESEPEKEFSLYTTHKPGYDRAYLNLYQLDPEEGEKFRVTPATRYARSDFVGEYNVTRPRGLENTALVERGDDLYLKVGESELRFVESKLRVYQGRVVLDGKVEGAGDVKISKALDGFDFRLKDHSRVTSMKEGPQGAMLSYERTGHDPYPHRRIILEGETQSFPTAKREVPLIVGRIEVRTRTAEGNILRFRLKADEEAVEHVMNELDSARNVDEFRKLKGDIAEELVKRVGPNLGLMVKADHPFNDDPLKTGSERIGPDLLASLGEHGDLSYVEVKWWAIMKNAAREATLQVQSDLRKHPTWDGLPVRGAYTAIVDWRPESDQFSLTLERVDSKSARKHGFNR